MNIIDKLDLFNENKKPIQQHQPIQNHQPIQQEQPKNITISSIDKDYIQKKNQILNSKHYY